MEAGNQPQKENYAFPEAVLGKLYVMTLCKLTWIISFFLKTGLTRTVLLLFVVMLASGADT